MITTEQEAREMRCCVEGCGVPGNPWSDGGPPTRWCDSSKCMGWRFLDPVEEAHSNNQQHRPEGEGWQYIDSHIHRCGWFRLNPNRRGYCGRAGIPTV